MSQNAQLVFKDGTVFKGRYFTDIGSTYGEVVFNTAMTGYQEILTDPSYCGQLVVMTYPIIGSYGVNIDDNEADKCHVKALIVKEYFSYPSNWRSSEDLKSFCERHNVVGIENVDTRYLTRYLRDKGAQSAWLGPMDDSIDSIPSHLDDIPDMEGLNLVDQVSVKQSYIFPSKTAATHKIAVIDCGVKLNILRIFSQLGCECVVFPHTVTAHDILESDADGVFISNGPGDPAVVDQVIQTIRDLIGKKPLFGICLGHQLICLALGAKTFKLQFGHHGANHPILDKEHNRVCVSSQNHGFCVDQESLNNIDVDVTHVNLNDSTVAGIRHRSLPIFAVQFHPEAAPGPKDSFYLFKDFIQSLQKVEV